MQTTTACRFDLSLEEIASARSQALAFLDQYELPATPDNYAVAFDYVSKRTDGLIHDLELHVKRNGVLKGDLLFDLFERYFLPGQEQELEDYISNLQHFLYEVLEGIKVANNGTDEFTGVLNTQLVELDKGPGADRVCQIIKNLVDAAKKSIEVNRRLTEHTQTIEKEALEMRDELNKLREDLCMDALTGLFNRRALSQKLKDSLKLTKESGLPFSFLIIDIDRFKHFNDTYGHLVGDEVLRRVAYKVKDCVRGTDFAGRYGGEEFGVLLPETEIEGAITVAHTINHAVSKLILLQRASLERLPQVTVSVGVSTARKEDSVESIVDRADRAMYRSKETGRNQVFSEKHIK